MTADLMLLAAVCFVAGCAIVGYTLWHGRPSVRLRNHQIAVVLEHARDMLAELTEDGYLTEDESRLLNLVAEMASKRPGNFNRGLLKRIDSEHGYIAEEFWI